MAGILNSAILDLAILHKLWLKLIQSDSKSFILSQLDDGSHLEFCLLAFNHFAQKKLLSFILTQLDDGSHLEFCHLGFSHYAQTLTQTNSIWFQTHSFSLNLMMVAFFNLAILDLTILVFPLILTHTCQEWFPPFAQKNLLTFASPPFAQKNFTHSFWLNLMMAAILNPAMLDSDTAILASDTLLSFLRFTQKYSHSTLTLNQTNSIWLKLIQSDSNSFILT